MQALSSATPLPSPLPPCFQALTSAPPPSPGEEIKLHYSPGRDDSYAYWGRASVSIPYPWEAGVMQCMCSDTSTC